MHELSIAQSLLDLVGRHVPEADRGLVRAVRVKVGRMAGVVTDSLTFCFDAIAPPGGFPNASLDVESVSAAALCRDCRHPFEIDEPAFACPACGSARIEVTGGDELWLREIVLDDAPAEVS